jgi:hypothetical protein
MRGTIGGDAGEILLLLVLLDVETLPPAAPLASSLRLYLFPFFLFHYSWDYALRAMHGSAWGGVFIQT